MRQATGDIDVVQPAYEVRSHPRLPHSYFISQKVFIESFCRSLFPHKSVNVSFTPSNIKNKSTDWCGNGLLQNEFMNTEMSCSRHMRSDFTRACRIHMVTALEATHGQMNGFFSQLPYKCHIEEVASVGD